MMKKFLFATLSTAICLSAGILPAVASETTGEINVGVQTGMEGVIKAAPTASPVAGEYHATQTVSLTASGSTAICYTTDGTTPACATPTTCTTGTKYSAAISVTTTTTVTGKACYADSSSGPASSDTYTLTCSTATVTNGTVADYPLCSITCNSGYTLSGSVCSANTSTGSISGGGGSTVSSSASGSLTSAGGSVTLAAASDSPSVKFNAPDGALGGATTVTIAKVSSTSSSYTPPANTTGLFMVGGNVFQITAVSGSTSVTNFDKPVTLIFTYTAAQIPAGVAEANLKIYYYNAAAKAWVEVASTVNTTTHTITATVDHLTQFAIYGKKTAGGAAATIAQLQALLNSLIAQLKVAVRQMVAQGKYVSPALMIYVQDATTSAPTAATTQITRTWSFGQTGEEVKTIQTILAKDPTVYPQGLVTGYFGSATLAAVQKFQVKYGIAGPGSAGYGIVGSSTRVKMNSLLQ